MPTQPSVSSTHERGSLAPLGIGLALLSLSTVLVVLAAGSVYLTERRLTTLAEATALAVIFEGDLSRDLFQLGVEYLETETLQGLDDVELIEVSSSDQKTVRVRLCSSWIPIFESYMFSENGRVCSEALARRGR